MQPKLVLVAYVLRYLQSHEQEMILCLSVFKYKFVGNFISKGFCFSRLFWGFVFCLRFRVGPYLVMLLSCYLYIFESGNHLIAVEGFNFFFFLGGGVGLGVWFFNVIACHCRSFHYTGYIKTHKKPSQSSTSYCQGTARKKKYQTGNLCRPF